MAQTRYYSSTAQKTTLVDPVDAADTSFTVAQISGYPSSFPFTILVDRDTIDEEVCEVTSVSGDVFTVTRGVDGTPAVAHSVGAQVEHGVSGRDFRESDQHRSSSEHVHGIELGSEVVGTTDTQTLTNKTIDSPVIINPTLQGEIIDGGDGPTPPPPGDIDIIGDVDMNTYRVTNMGDAVDDQDAVTKSQLDAQIDLVNGATVDAGSTTTGDPGTDASVVNSGTQNAAVFDFTIPRGEQGAAFTFDDFTPEQLEALKGEDGKDGADGSGIQIVDIVDSAADLPDPNSYAGGTGDIIITDDDSHGWVFDADVPEWNDIGELRGPQGEQGEPGEDIALPDPAEAGLVLTSTADSYEWAEPAGGGLDVDATREDAVLQVKDTNGVKEWVEGMAFTIAENVPDDSDGEVGDVVFVLSDPKVEEPGLPGLGGWADVTSVTGDSGNRYTYTDADGDWVAYEFTDDGTLDISEGLVDMVLIGPGAGNRTSAPGGSGGQLIHGFHKLNSGSHQVSVEPYSSDAKTQTKIEGPTNLYSGWANANSRNSLGINRPSDDDLTAGKGAFFSYITGQKVYYGIAEDGGGSKPNNPEYPQSKGVRPNKGDGGGYGGSSWNRPGSAGCLIVRVPAANAFATIPNTWGDL